MSVTSGKQFHSPDASRKRMCLFRGGYTLKPISNLTVEIVDNRRDVEYIGCYPLQFGYSLRES